MKKFTLFIFLLVLLGRQLCAQVVFEKSYPVDINNEFSYISQLMLLPDSSYLFSTTAYHNSDNFLLLGRIDHLGNILWVKQVNDIFQISEANFALSQSNELYVAYSAWNGNSSQYYSVVVKMDLNANLIWSKSFGDTTRSESCEHIFLTPTSIYLTGETYFGGASELYLLKLDIAGNYIWGKTYNAGSVVYLRDAKQLSNGDILLSGMTVLTGHFWNPIFRIDTNGNIVWKKRFSLPTLKEINSQAIVENYDGTLLITGHVDTVDVVSSTYFGKWDISIMKLAATGNFLWGKIYGGSDFDEVWQVLPTDDHGFIFAAEPESFGNVSRISLMKTDSVGSINWMKLYGQATGGFPNNIVINHDKGYSIIATDGNNNVMAQMLFIRTDSLGASICPDSTVTLPQLSFTPIIDTLGGMGAISGIALFTPMISNYPLVATDYCNANFFQNISSDYFLQVYPNPFSTSISLSIHKQRLSNVMVSIRNTLGQTVYKSIEPNHTNSFFKNIDVSEFVNGIYLLELIIDSEITTRKIIKQ